MSDLAAFLLARIAEEEAVIGNPPSVEGLVDPAPPHPSVFWIDCKDEHGASLTMLIWRARAECEAKRKIVELHNRSHECSQYDRGGIDTCSWVDADGTCSTLRLLALPYASCPGYRNKWRRP